MVFWVVSWPHAWLKSCTYRAYSSWRPYCWKFPPNCPITKTTRPNYGNLVFYNLVDIVVVVVIAITGILGYQYSTNHVIGEYETCRFRQFLESCSIGNRFRCHIRRNDYYYHRSSVPFNGKEEWTAELSLLKKLYARYDQDQRFCGLTTERDLEGQTVLWSVAQPARAEGSVQDSDQSGSAPTRYEISAVDTDTAERAEVPDVPDGTLPLRFYQPVEDQ